MDVGFCGGWDFVPRCFPRSCGIVWPHVERVQIKPERLPQPLILVQPPVIEKFCQRCWRRWEWRDVSLRSPPGWEEVRGGQGRPLEDDYWQGAEMAMRRLLGDCLAGYGAAAWGPTLGVMVGHFF